MSAFENCKECEEELNDDDRRWVGARTLYCRECVCEPVFQAMTNLRLAKETAKKKSQERRELKQ